MGQRRRHQCRIQKISTTLQAATRLLVLVSVSCLGAAPAFAQSSSLAERLPPNIWLYVYWHGSGSLESAQQSNNILKLWADPSFAPVRRALSEQISGAATKGARDPKLVETELQMAASLLERPFVFGVAGSANPFERAADPPSGSSSAKRPAGTFLVYDGRGKTDYLSLLRIFLLEANKEKSEVTHYTFGPTTVETIAQSAGTDYQAVVGDYFVRADAKEVIEDLITRFRNTEPAGSSLAGLAPFQKLHPPTKAETALEFFAQVPDWSKVHLPPSRGFDPSTLVHSLHLEKLHAMGGSLRFEGPVTRFQMAVLGDTSPGGIFDLVGQSGPTFLTLPLAAPGSFYSVSRFNYAALYQMIRQAVVAAAPSGMPGSISTFEDFAAKMLGMPIADVFQLLTGEYASVSSLAPDGSLTELHAITIRQPQDVLHVLRAVFSTMIAAEDQSGDTTYLDLPVPYIDPQTKQQRRHFYYVAVTPQMVFVAPHKSMIREAIARMAAKPGANTAATLAADPDFLRGRASLPEKLTGFDYADLSRIPWDKLFSALDQKIEENFQKSDQTKTPPEWLKQVDPAVFSRYLHVSVGGWWKSPDGVYIDSFIQ